MQLLGIALKTPEISSIIGTAVMGVIISCITTVLILNDMTTVQNGVPLAAGAIAGAVANAYGVSIKGNGWRGLVVTAFFSIALMAIVRVFM